MKSIVVVDDHSLIRSGLAAALNNAGYKVIAEAASKAEALAVLNNHSPDFCIIDLNLGDGDGLEVISTSRSKLPNTNFLILTMNDDEVNLAQAKECGAAAYILKSAPISELLEVLTSITNDKNTFKAVGNFVKGASSENFGLTLKELEVLQLLGSGATAATMGKRLFLTEATIKTHLAAIYRKLNAANRAQALSIAISNKLISD